MQALHATGKPMVMVNCSGSAIALPWEAEQLPAILQAWYPGEEGGRAVGEVLFGDVNPSGHLPLTFYRATTDLPSFHGLLDDQPHLPLFQRHASLCVRSRLELHQI